MDKVRKGAMAKLDGVERRHAFAHPRSNPPTPAHPTPSIPQSLNPSIPAVKANLDKGAMAKLDKGAMAKLDEVERRHAAAHQRGNHPTPARPQPSIPQSLNPRL